jgi:hypothetical protein
LRHKVKTWLGNNMDAFSNADGKSRPFKYLVIFGIIPTAIKDENENENENEKEFYHSLPFQDVDYMMGR